MPHWAKKYKNLISNNIKILFYDSFLQFPIRRSRRELSFLVPHTQTLLLVIILKRTKWSEENGRSFVRLYGKNIEHTMALSEWSHEEWLHNVWMIGCHHFNGPMKPAVLHIAYLKRAKFEVFFVCTSVFMVFGLICNFKRNVDAISVCVCLKCICEVCVWAWRCLGSLSQ